MDTRLAQEQAAVLSCPLKKAQLKQAVKLGKTVGFAGGFAPACQNVPHENLIRFSSLSG
jgi:hypothetical protein